MWDGAYFTLPSDGDFVVQPNWETTLPGITSRFPTQSQYRDTELTSPSPTLVIPNARLGCDKYQFVKLFA